MEINKSDIPTEPLPQYTKNIHISNLINEIQTNSNLSPTELYNKIEIILLEKLESNTVESKYILGQFYYDYKQYKKAFNTFNMIKDVNYQSLYQLAIILYDDLLDLEEPVGAIDPDDKILDEKLLPSTHFKRRNEIDTKTAFRHPNRENWELAVSYLKRIAELPNVGDVKFFAWYNVGKAYFQGFGAKQSDDETERYWLMAADDGNSRACVTAMTMLAFFYSRKIHPEYFNLKKAFFWHNEACGNGSIESQGALGAMYYFSVGCNKDLNAAYDCLTESAERGNVYSMGLLCDFYYKNKFYVKASDLAQKVTQLTDIDKIAQETGCIKIYIKKGIALASFILARSYHLGRGVKKNEENASVYYKKCFEHDPEECQRLQNNVTHGKI